MDKTGDDNSSINEIKSEEVTNTSDFEQVASKEMDSKSEDLFELASATNPNVVTCNTNIEVNSEAEKEVEGENEKAVNVKIPSSDSDSNKIIVENETLHKQDNVSDSLVKSDENGTENDLDSVNENIELNSTDFVRPALGRMRKLSLDQSILSRSEGLSQSELNLSYIGKKPLERKPSFFRKKMDTFLRNTTEMFKKRSSQLQSSSKTGSLQCLNENQLKTANSDENFRPGSLRREDSIRNGNSLTVKPPIARSVSSLSVCQSGRYARHEQNLADGGSGSQPVLNVLSASTEEIEDNDLSSVHSLNESFLREHMLKSRAISMNSGLNLPTAHHKKRASRSNRPVTWVASEGVANYFRRLQDLSEQKAEMQPCHSYQDFSKVPDFDSAKKKVDSKGRRLSYQRAVSGEDPVLPSRYPDSIRTRNPIPENNEAHYELANQLAEFSANGVPQLQGFALSPATDEVFAYLMWAETPTYIDDIFDWKCLTPEEEARQSVIKELINTEADYIRHLVSVVEVFIATAHTLQDSGRMLNVETERLFSNLPDVLNASLNFWQTAFLPMIKDSVAKAKPFNTELMAPGFCRFREILSPYDRYVKEQSKTVEYLRSISSDPEFTMYLNWCHSHKLCNRLQLADFLVKPMQRLTKYSLILRRIITHTDTEPERTSLLAMETFSKNYVLDLNRSVRQREELEKLEEVANSIDSYEVDFKDEDLDRYFRMFSQLNLRSPMVGCVGSQSRCVVFQGDMRFKDNVKEIEVHVFLLTDMLLVCKKMTKGNYPYKLIRPKYMIDRMIQFPRYVSRTNKDLSGLVYVVVDDVGSSYTSFVLSETAKDPNPLQTLRTWELKVREAKMSYDLSVWFARNPHRDLSEMEMDSSDYSIFSRGTPEDSSAEIEARERVAVMLHRSMGTSTEFDITQSITTDSFEGSGRPGRAGLRHLIHRTSTASSRNSRLSSFQQSTSAASHDEPHAGPSRIYKPGISCEHTILPPHGTTNITSITVNVVSESESDTAVSTQQEVSPASKSPDKSSESQKTLHVQTQNNVVTLVHSLPDLTIEPSTPRSTSSPTVPSASEKLYQSHQELLQRNRLVVAQQHQYLSPDHRGSSYPPPSPTRASLKRGLAFSYSFKNPPLAKMGHVNSQSQVQVETASTSSSYGKIDRSPSPKASSEKSEKKTKLISSRNKDADDDGQSGPSRAEDRGE